VFDDVDWQVLANFSNLTSLSLRGKKVSNAVLKSFSSRAGGLKELILADRNDYFRGSDYLSQKEVCSHCSLVFCPLVSRAKRPVLCPVFGLEIRVCPVFDW